MTFFTRNNLGSVYVIRLHLDDGAVLHKIGMCYKERFEQRLAEILTSWFTHYRYVPYTVLRVNKQTGFPKELEKHIHLCLEKNRTPLDKKISGYTEFFSNINEYALVHYLKNFQESEIPVINTLDSKTRQKLSRLFT